MGPTSSKISGQRQAEHEDPQASSIATMSSSVLENEDIKSVTRGSHVLRPSTSQTSAARKITPSEISRDPTECNWTRPYASIRRYLIRCGVSASAPRRRFRSFS